MESESPALAAVLPDMPTEAQWEERLQAANRNRIRIQEGQQQHERDKVDVWLRALLMDGPVRRDRIVARPVPRTWPSSGDPMGRACPRRGSA